MTDRPETFAVILMSDGTVQLEPREGFDEEHVPVAVAAVKAVMEALTTP